jgi:Tfp pilus assembly protein PilF
MERIGLLQPIDEQPMQFATARLHEQQGNLEKAQELYTQLASQQPSRPDVSHRLGVIAIKRGNVTEGIRLIERALDKEPRNSEMLTDLGYALYMQNRLPEAADALDQAIRENPQNKRAMNNMGLVMGWQGRADESLAAFRRAGSDAHAHTNLAYVHARMGDLDMAERHFSRALDYDADLRQAAEGLLQLLDRREKIARREHESVARSDSRRKRDSSSLRELGEAKLVDYKEEIEEEEAPRRRSAEGDPDVRRAEYHEDDRDAAEEDEPRQEKPSRQRPPRRKVVELTSEYFEEIDVDRGDEDRADDDRDSRR